MKKAILIGAAVLVLGGGGAAAFFLMKEEPPAEGEAAVAAAPKLADPIYRPLSPKFVINFERRGTTSYVQLGMQVMARSQDVIDKVELNDPAIRNQLIMLFSGQDFDALGTLEGKEKLRELARDSVNEVIGLAPETGVEEVYFTEFVMQ